MSRLRQLARKHLNRPGGRLLLGAAASVWYSAKRRQPCLISWREGAWAHRYRDATIPHERLGDAPPPAEFTAEARDIFLYGYEPGEGDIVFDIGAGVGAETLLFSRLVGTSGRVVALEAHPGTFDRLALLCRLNGLANVVPLQVAAADADGQLSISDANEHVANTILDGGAGGIAVPARRLDSVATELGITHVDLLKMNIEGGEHDALAGMQELIEHTRHVCISCHDFLAEQGGSERLRTKVFVRDFLLEHGFSLRSRNDAKDPWTRDYVYGVNEHLA